MGLLYTVVVVSKPADDEGERALVQQQSIRFASLAGPRLQFQYLQLKGPSNVKDPNLRPWGSCCPSDNTDQYCDLTPSKAVSCVHQGV